MTYRELLELYESGKLDGRQKAEVEAEIEKYEAIGDYVFDRAESLAADDIKLPASDTEAEGGLAAQINRSVHQKLIRLGAAVGAAVLILVLAVIFILPHAVDCFFYDPTETLTAVKDGEEREIKRLNLDLSVWTELFMPGRYRCRAEAEPLGYGRYSLIFPATGNAEHTNGSFGGFLSKNRLTLYDTGALNPDYAFFGDVIETDDSTDMKELSFSGIEKELKDDETYIACISLSEPVDYESLYKWCADRKIYYDLWFNVYYPPMPGVPGWGQALGFSLFTSPYGSSSLVFDSEKYPELVMPYGWSFEEGPQKTHFLSLLAYVKDNPEFCSVMHNLHSDYAEYIDFVTEYVRENGLKLSGFSFAGSKSEILALRDEEIIKYVTVSPYYG